MKKKEELAKLNKKLGKETQGYGSPKPYKPQLEFNTQLLYGANDWCIVLDNRGKAYGITQDKDKHLRVKEL